MAGVAASIEGGVIDVSNALGAQVSSTRQTIERVQRMPEHRRVVVSGGGIPTPEAVHLVVEALLESPACGTMESFVFENIRVGESAVDIVAKVIQCAPKLQYVAVRDCALGDRGVEEMVHEVAADSRASDALTFLDVRNNGVTALGNTFLDATLRAFRGHARMFNVLTDGAPADFAPDIVRRDDVTLSNVPSVLVGFLDAHCVVKRWRGTWSARDAEAHPHALFVYGDNEQRRGRGGQAVIRDCANAVGVRTKIRPSLARDAFWTDDAALLSVRKEMINSDIDNVVARALEGFDTVYVSQGGIGSGLAQLDRRAPRLYAHLQQRIRDLPDMIAPATS